MPQRSEDAEAATCARCGSNVRTRGLLHALTQELFGCGLTLPAMPRLKSLRGLGISDADLYARLLEQKLSYRNTFFHREPRLDIAQVPESETGQYDFVLSSEVLEHVAPPVDRAFQNISRMLRPNGVLVFTVPYSLQATTAEHFPELHEYNVARLGDRLVLVNRTREGNIQTYENLVFHGGEGSTLEMRVFSEDHLRAMLRSAGFCSIRMYSEEYPEYGIVRSGVCSLPIAARKGEFAFSVDAARELTEQFNGFMRSKWVRLGVWLKLMRSR
jgi:SAM-dependent methyltransferase